MITYSEKLKDPRWQKRRLDILNLHEFACEKCGSKDKELHVHHRFYLKGREVWEYDNDVFQVLCIDCHEKEHRKTNTNTATEKYNKLKTHLNKFEDNQIWLFMEGVANVIVTRDNMDDFNYILSHIGTIGFSEGFRSLLKEIYIEQNEIDLWTTINELKATIIELKLK